MLTQEREHLSARATKKLEKTVEKRTSTANLPEQKTEARQEHNDSMTKTQHKVVASV